KHRHLNVSIHWNFRDRWLTRRRTVNPPRRSSVDLWSFGQPAGSDPNSHPMIARLILEAESQSKPDHKSSNGDNGTQRRFLSLTGWSKLMRMPRVEGERT